MQNVVMYYKANRHFMIYMSNVEINMLDQANWRAIRGMIVMFSKTKPGC